VKKIILAAVVGAFGFLSFGQTVIGFDQASLVQSNSTSIVHVEGGYRFEIWSLDSAGERQVSLENRNLRLWPYNSTKDGVTPAFPYPFKGNVVFSQNQGWYPAIYLLPGGPSTMRLISIDVFNNDFRISGGRVVGFKPDGGTVEEPFSFGKQSGGTVELPSFAGIDLIGVAVMPLAGQISRYAVDNLCLAATGTALPSASPPPAPTVVVSPLPAATPAVSSRQPAPTASTGGSDVRTSAAPLQIASSPAVQPSPAVVAPAVVPETAPQRPGGAVPLLLSLGGLCVAVLLWTRFMSKS
jgi:hypothetical protein